LSVTVLTGIVTRSWGRGESVVSMFDLTGDEHEKVTSRPESRGPELAASGAGTAAGVLNLQRQAGNAAVSRAIQEGALGVGTPLDVQRLETDAEEEEDVDEGS
jgi:hypothetical protein